MNKGKVAMKLSLIIGTLNRKDALLMCIDSLLSQTYQNFEIIIIDQSDNSDTELAIEEIADERIIYKRVNYKGLSKARNEALRLSTGEYFCLIDDDANYNKDYLSIAKENVNSRTILSGYIFDTIKQCAFARYKETYNYKYLPLRMIIRTCPSAGLVIPMSVINEVGFFDEEFGIGGHYGSGEETDLLLRALKKGYRVKFIDGLRLKHPVPVIQRPIDSDKKRKYAMGLGALFRKHRGYGSLFFVKVEHVLRLLAKIVLLKGDRRKQAIEELKGLRDGYTQYTVTA